MFHDIRFPTAISRGARGGPERRTDIVALGSGAEERNARWADSRRSYDAGYGVTSLDDLHAIVAFFEERRGRLHGFRWRDPLDHKSCAPNAAISPLDQQIGVGTGTRATFELTKLYGSTIAPYARRITRPVAGSVVVAVAGITQPGTAYTVDHATGTVAFLSGRVPISGALVTAGFEFDVPVRFDTDKLEINLSGFRSGAIPSIPLIEIRDQ
ncbi:MAG: TIGR02217 family protein [Hyphomicrobiales bacterium]|nr:TIGR02217 family protein [Hyphomicrobiales bacterium]